MTDDRMTVAELAEAAGITRRAVRFYVQRGLLESPEGRGRGSRYTPRHLERLGRIQDLQAAGHSLDAVRRILAGEASEAVPAPARISRSRRRHRSPPGISTELLTRVRLAEGVELNIDLSRHPVRAEGLLRIREAVVSVLDLPRPGDRPQE